MSVTWRQITNEKTVLIVAAGYFCFGGSLALLVKRDDICSPVRSVNKRVLLSSAVPASSHNFPLSCFYPRGLYIAFIMYRLGSFEVHIKRTTLFFREHMPPLYFLKTLYDFLTFQNGIIILLFQGHLGFLEVTWNSLAQGTPINSRGIKSSSFNL